MTRRLVSGIRADGSQEETRGRGRGILTPAQDQVAEFDEVVTRKTYRATRQGTFLGGPATGRTVAFNAIDLLNLRDGRYVEHRALADVLGLLGQLTAH